MTREHTRDSRAGLGCTGLFAIAAFGLIIFATALCNFVRVTGTASSGELVSLHRGIWNGQAYADSPACGSYDGLYQGTKWNSAKAMGSIISILGCFSAAMAIWPLVCACGKQITMATVLGIGSNCMWACLWSGLTLLMLPSEACKASDLTDVTCEMDTGAKYSIAATVLFFVSSMSISCSIAVATVADVTEEQENTNKDDAASGKDEEDADTAGKDEEEG